MTILFCGLKREQKSARATATATVGVIAARSAYGEGEARGYYFADAEMDLVDGGVFANGEDAVRLASGDLFVLCMNATVEVVGLALETAFVSTLFFGVALVAAAGALERGFEGRQEKKREIGLEVFAGGGVHGEDAGAAKLAASSLIGLGGVGVAIAEDDVTVGEGGEDDLRDGLGAVGEHEGHLGGGGDGAERGFGGGVDEDGADAVAEWSASGLAECDDGASFGFERSGEAAELRSFSGAVETFKGDEISALHR